MACTRHSGVRRVGRRLSVTAGVAAGAAVLVMAAGCAGAEPAGGPAVTSQLPVGDAPPVTSATPPRAVALALLDPCTLIDTQQAIAYGYAEREPFTVGSTRSCVYTASDQSATLTISFGDGGVAGLRPNQADQVSSQQVGAHNAARIESGTAPMCTLVIDISGRESVTVQATLSSVEAACAQAAEVATGVEPMLP